VADLPSADEFRATCAPWRGDHERPNRLFFDIETSPNIGLFWKPGDKVSITYDNIIKERAIICIAWKWEGKAAIACETWDKHQNDRALLIGFAREMERADELVAHFGAGFDVPWIRGRCVKHGIPLSPDFTIIDTYKLTKRRLGLNSGALDYQTQFLGLGKKQPTSFALWKAITVDNDPKAMAKMVRYCKHDVRILEKLYNRVAPWLPSTSNRAGYMDQCPECSSNHTREVRRRVTASGYEKVQFRCDECGRYHTIAASRYNGKAIGSGR